MSTKVKATIAAIGIPALLAWSVYAVVWVTRVHASVGRTDRVEEKLETDSRKTFEKLTQIDAKVSATEQAVREIRADVRHLRRQQGDAVGWSSPTTRPFDE